MPTRNKFVYSCSVKIRDLGFDKLLESIFCLQLVVEAFSLQKIVEILEEAVISWQEVRRIWEMRQNFLVQFTQLLKHWLCDKLSGTVLQNWALSVDQHWVRCSSSCISLICLAYFSIIMVSLGFRNLQWVRWATDHQTVTMTFFRCKFGFGKWFGASS